MEFANTGLTRESAQAELLVEVGFQQVGHSAQFERGQSATLLAPYGIRIGVGADQMHGEALRNTLDKERAGPVATGQLAAKLFQEHRKYVVLLTGHFAQSWRADRKSTRLNSSH